MRRAFSLLVLATASGTTTTPTHAAPVTISVKTLGGTAILDKYEADSEKMTLGYLRRLVRPGGNQNPLTDPDVSFVRGEGLRAVGPGEDKNTSVAAAFGLEQLRRRRLWSKQPAPAGQLWRAPLPRRRRRLRSKQPAGMLWHASPAGQNGPGLSRGDSDSGPLKLELVAVFHDASERFAKFCRDRGNPHIFSNYPTFIPLDRLVRSTIRMPERDAIDAEDRRNRAFVEAMQENIMEFRQKWLEHVVSLVRDFFDLTFGTGVLERVAPKETDLQTAPPEVQRATATCWRAAVDAYAEWWTQVETAEGDGELRPPLSEWVRNELEPARFVERLEQ